MERIGRKCVLFYFGVNMSEQYRYTLVAKRRDDNGKGASRRLRREGWVPAIVYGGEGEPLSIAVSQNELIKFGQNDSFYSQIINLQVEGLEDQEVLVRDVQRHLFKPLYQHMDFQRIVRGQEISATVVIHVLNVEESVGVKAGGVSSQVLNTLDIICRPRHLPEKIEVDVAHLGIGESVCLSDITLPEGVRLQGEWTEEALQTTVVAQVLPPQPLETESTEEGADEAADESATDETAE